MRRNPSIEALERDEQLARGRVAGHRAKVNQGKAASTLPAKLRLEKLQRAHRMALARLRRARKGT